jgi:hypothetical protein
MTTRNFTSKCSMAALCLLIMMTGALTGNAQADELPSLKGKKILMVWGGWEPMNPVRLPKR